MKFIDANVFIYAFSAVRRTLKPHEIAIKEQAKTIIRKIGDGEKVIISVVHISEILNYFEEVSLELSIAILENIMANENIMIQPVSEEDYFIAKELAKKLKVGINDCLALHIMDKNGIEYIYSFDKDFDRVSFVKRLEQ